ncbi:MAG: glycine oxidase ThiO [Gemmatimonadota bacterium]
MRPGTDAIVLGAGAVGLAVARRLARAGRRVTVLEPELEGGAASRAAAGMLTPQIEATGPDAFFALGRAARDGYAAFVDDLDAETGVALDFRRDGLLACEPHVDGETELARRAEWQRAAGLRVEELEREEVAARWPALELPAPLAGAAGGDGRTFHFPDEAQIDPVRLLRALLASCRAAGVELRLGERALGLLRGGDRVAGVRTARGPVAADLVVNAAGAWAGIVGGWAGEALPVEPVRGEMLAYATELTPPRPIVVSGGAYAVLRTGGRLLVGATVERAGWAARTTPEGEAWLRAGAAAILPALAGAAPLESWAGLRPGTPDDLPILGASTEVAGLYHATGHFRNGILLAPLTAEIVSGEIAGEAWAREAAAPFRPERFVARPAEAAR